MEVHHHSHTARKKWTHYFWEFLMLFLAVFCGFLAEYQLEHYIEKQRAKEFALSLHRDLAADTLAYERNIKNLNTCVTNIDSLIGLLDKKGEVIKNTSSIYKLSVYAFVFPGGKPNESTIQQLLNSGSLRYFRSNRLIDSVKEYNREIQLFKDFREDIGSFNIEFRKAQGKVLELNPLITAFSLQSTFEMEKIHPNSLFFPPNTQLLTTDPFLLKEYANWCTLKKFYMNRSALHFKFLKLQAGAVLRLLKEEYHFK